MSNADTNPKTDQRKNRFFDQIGCFRSPRMKAFVNPQQTKHQPKNTPTTPTFHECGKSLPLWIPQDDVGIFELPFDVLSENRKLNQLVHGFRIRNGCLVSGQYPERCCTPHSRESPDSVRACRNKMRLAIPRSSQHLLRSIRRQHTTLYAEAVVIISIFQSKPGPKRREGRRW